MGVDGVKNAQRNLAAAGAITSQVSDLAATGTPDADTGKYIQPVRTTAGKDARHITYTVNTVIEKCYRLSGTMDCKTASQLGISATSSIVNLDGAAANDIREAILRTDKVPGRGFQFGGKSYMPMVRVVVSVTWPDNLNKDRTCVYATNELLNVVGD